MQLYNLTEIQYQLIAVSQYAVCIPFAIFSGMLIDKLGSKRSVLFFASLVMIGLLIAALAANESLLNFRLFLVGWAIFGMGEVGTLIWYSSINSIFFFYTHNAMSMALLVCFTAFGTSMADIIVPYLYKRNPSLTDVIMMGIYM